VIVLWTTGWLALVAGVSYQSNPAWPTRRSLRARLLRNNATLRTVFDREDASGRRATAILARAQRRVDAARRAARRRLVAGLLSVVGAATLVNAPVADERRSRHSTGLETIQTV
jgi:hypothetical protein